MDKMVIRKRLCAMPEYMSCVEKKSFLSDYLTYFGESIDDLARFVGVNAEYVKRWGETGNMPDVTIDWLRTCFGFWPWSVGIGC